MMTWLIICNTNQCMIYQYENKNEPLVFIKQLLHPESKLKGAELTTDKPGHYKANSSARGSYAPDETPKQMEIECFAQEIAKTLDSDRKNQAFQHIVFITLPKMYGLIQQHSTESLKTLIRMHINKDYMHFSEQEILEHFEKERIQSFV